MPEKSTPIIVSAAQITHRGDLDETVTPLNMLEQVARKILSAASSADISGTIDTIGIVQPTIKAKNLRRLPVGQLENTGLSLGKRLGITPAQSIECGIGGNSPQMLINTLAERIAEGEARVALVAGTEFLGHMMKVLNAGKTLESWGEEAATAPEHLGSNKDGETKFESAHGLSRPVNVYPLFENGLRGHYGLSLEQHRQALGRLCEPFTRVAAENPYAWFPVYRSAEEIATVNETNRMIGFPYPKYMNAIIQVDMSAGVLMMSVEAAQELGIDPGKWVYLHGCADATDLWYVTERQNYHSSPAIRTIGRQAMDMAGLSIADMDYIDLYSCFPCAVQIAADELGLAHDDPRGLTLTGGLPYFGGPGNNYVMHSIATAIERLQANPGKRALVTANGWYLTKHSIGIYSTLPVEGGWQRLSPSVYQSEIDQLPHPEFEAHPQGRAEVETYTVVNMREGPAFGIVIGRLENGRRFVANTPKDPEVLNTWMSEEFIGRKGTVTTDEDGLKNTFVAD